MAGKSLEERMDSLERRVETLEQLPAQVAAPGSQILQLREEMRSEFSATRTEARAGDADTRRSLLEEIRAGDEETRRVLREEIRTGDEETRRVLRDEIRTGDEETRKQMRVLHEDLVARISLIGRR